MKKLKLSKEEYPWFKFYKDVPTHIEYPDTSMTNVIMETALKYPDNYALEYYNKGKAKYLMHPDTAALLEDMLTHLANEGEEATNQYIRKNILHNK